MATPLPPLKAQPDREHVPDDGGNGGGHHPARLLLSGAQRAGNARPPRSPWPRRAATSARRRIFRRCARRLPRQYFRCPFRECPARRRRAFTIRQPEGNRTQQIGDERISQSGCSSRVRPSRTRNVCNVLIFGARRFQNFRKDEIPTRAPSRNLRRQFGSAARTSFSTSRGALSAFEPRQREMWHVTAALRVRCPAAASGLFNVRGEIRARFGEASTPHHITRGRLSSGKNPTPRKSSATGLPERNGSLRRAAIDLRAALLSPIWPINFKRDVHASGLAPTAHPGLRFRSR